MYLVKLFILFSICLSQDDNIVVIPSESYDDWVYFSLESNSIVEISDSENSLNWDISFKRNNIKTNSGLSGIGQGGGYVDESRTWSNELWESTNKLPDDLTIQIDSEIEGTEGQLFPPYSGCYCLSCPNGTFHQFLTCTKNPALDKWGEFDVDRYFNVSNFVLFVKSSNAKIYKFWPFSYYSTDGPGGFITLRYKEVCGLLGDVNTDGDINVTDITLSVDYIINNIDLNECQIIASDIDEDGLVTIVDIIQLLNTRILIN